MSRQGYHLCWLDLPAVTSRLPLPPSNPRPSGPSSYCENDLHGFPEGVCVQPLSSARAGASRRSIYRSSRVGADLPKRPAESHIWGPERLGDTTSRGKVFLSGQASNQIPHEWLPYSGGHSPLKQPSPYHGELGCATTCLTRSRNGRTLDIANVAGREDHSTVKCLTIIVDDKTLFSGEVAAVQWNEDDETVSVTARFKKQAGFLESLQQAAAARQQQAGGPAQTTIPDGTVPPRPTLVRDEPDAGE